MNTLVINKAAIISYIQGVKWLARGSVLPLVLVSEDYAKWRILQGKEKLESFSSLKSGV